MQRPTSEMTARILAARRVISPAAWQLLGLALCMRLLTSLWIAFVSPLNPLTMREQTIRVWPPSAPFGAWLERVLLAPWERWDVKYYLWIVQRGYRTDDGTAQFHPLLAWLATPLAWLTGQPLLALLVVSSTASALLLVAFERLARLDLPPVAARTSTLLLLFSPPAFILFAPYTESLFLLWAVLCLLWARRGWWWLAGLAGALATLTRQQGIALALPLAWELWDAAGRKPRRALHAWRDWLAVALIPTGLLVWLMYRAVVLGDLQANFASPQALIYSLIISPSSSKVVPVQAFLLPPHAMWLALSKFGRAPELSLLIDLILGGAWLALLCFAWRGMRTSYRIYSITIALLSFGYYTGPFLPYMGLPRHLLLAFPVFIGLGSVMRGRVILRPRLIAGGLLGILLLVWFYAFEAWVP